MAPTEPLLSHQFATAPDGAKLSYYTTGTGPSLLILHGAVCYALTHRELALALSPYFTVHTASRRGRGLSEAYPSSLPEPLLPPPSPSSTKPETASRTPGDHSNRRTYNPAFTAAVLAIETSDLQTLLEATKAEYLIAVSSGALVTLQYLIDTPSALALVGQLEKIIPFEPPLFPETDYQTTPSITQYETERAAGDDVSAMVTAMQIVQLGPGWVPRWLMRWVVGHLFRAEGKKGLARSGGRVKGVGGGVITDGEGKSGGNGKEDEGNVGMKGLGALLRFDFAVAEGMVGCEGRFERRLADVADGKKLGEESKADEQYGGRGFSQRVLLLGGDRSPAYLKRGLDLLKKSMGVRKAVLGGVGHEVLCGKEMRGRPEKAVPIIREFFGSE